MRDYRENQVGKQLRDFKFGEELRRRIRRWLLKFET
jgi:hypothetical protein